MPGWFYVNNKGERLYESMTDAQAATDLAVLGAASAVESALAADEKPTAEHRELVRRAAPLVATLPPGRQVHWRAEFARLGFELKQTNTTSAEVTGTATAKVSVPVANDTGGKK